MFLSLSSPLSKDKLKSSRGKKENTLKSPVFPGSLAAASGDVPATVLTPCFCSSAFCLECPAWVPSQWPQRGLRPTENFKKNPHLRVSH